MAKIISTLKYLITPEQSGQDIFTVETLGDNEGRIYYSCPDSFVADVQGIQDDDADYKEHTVEEVDAVKKTLRSYKQINYDVVNSIKEKYNTNQEMKAIRTNDATYITYVESCIVEGNTKKELLGF